MLPELTTEDYDIKSLSKDELLKVPHTFVRWQCKVDGCTHFTRLMDFGLEDEYYKKKGVKDIDTNEISFWIKPLKIFFICHKHYKMYKNISVEQMPLKRGKLGGLIWGGDDTGKEIVIY